MSQPCPRYNHAKRCLLLHKVVLDESMLQVQDDCVRVLLVLDDSREELLT